MGDEGARALGGALEGGAGAAEEGVASIVLNACADSKGRRMHLSPHGVTSSFSAINASPMGRHSDEANI